MSCTVISANSSRFSGTRLTPLADALLDGEPLLVAPSMDGPREGSSPMMGAISVVLPAPLGPTTVTMLPGVDGERDVVHGFDLAVARRAESRDLEQRRRHVDAAR